MYKKFICILLSLFVFVEITGQEKVNENLYFRYKTNFYLGVGVGLSFYDMHYLNTHFKTDEDRNEYGFECGMWPGFFGNVSFNLILKNTLDLSLYAEISSGSEWCILTEGNSFVVFSPGFDVKKYIPFGSGRHSFWGSVGAKFSYFKFGAYDSFNEGIRFRTGINLQSRSIMFQPFIALNIARTMHDDVTILPKYIYSDFQIGVELFF